VQPSIAANSGTGTSGDPYGDLQYALNTLTRDGTNGDQINIISGTAEILAASLTLATYGTPTSAASLLFRGCTATADDGGIGDINCNNFACFDSSTLDYISFEDMKIHGSGTAKLILLDSYCHFINCEFYDSSFTTYAFDINTGSSAQGCYFHDISGFGCTGGSSLFYGNRMEYAALVGVGLTNAGGVAINNVIKLSRTDGYGVLLSQHYTRAIGNSIYNSTAGTNSGVRATTAFVGQLVANNIIEGWSGTGGKGVDVAGNNATLLSNRFYNCTTNMTLTGNPAINEDNSSLSASGFTNAATGDFTPTTEVTATAFPSAYSTTTNYLDHGAVQKEAGGGGGGIKLAGFGGGMIG